MITNGRDDIEFIYSIILVFNNQLLSGCGVLVGGMSACGLRCMGWVWWWGGGIFVAPTILLLLRQVLFFLFLFVVFFSKDILFNKPIYCIFFFFLPSNVADESCSALTHTKMAILFWHRIEDIPSEDFVL